MSCAACREQSAILFQPGECETALLESLKSEFFKAIAALPPHLQTYLSCRLGILPRHSAQAFDVGRLIAALPAILQLLIQLGLIPASKSPAVASVAPRTEENVWLRSVAAAAAAFAAATHSTEPSNPAAPIDAPPLDPAAGYTPRPVARCA